MNLIREMATWQHEVLIEVVFNRLSFLARTPNAPVKFIGAKLDDDTMFSASNIFNRMMFEGIDELSFQATLYDWVAVPGKDASHISLRKEMVKILKAESMLSSEDLDRLEGFLKTFNDSQPEAVKDLMADTERLLAKYDGKFTP